MKKLIVMALSVAMAAIANAAVANWDAEIYEYGSTGNLATGYLAYFVASTDLTRADAITAVGAGNLTAITSVGYEADALSDDGWLEGNDVGSFTPGENLQAYLVVFNADEAATATFAFVSEEVTRYVPGSGAGVDFGGQFDLSDSATAGNWTAVPEPTSGLLLLVGGALLALKRRRV